MGLNPKRIAKAAKDFTIKLDFKNKKFPLQIRDIHKIGKRNSIENRSFVYQEKHATHVPKKCYKEKQVDVLLVGKKGKRHYVFSKMLILPCMIIFYSVKENIFAILFYKLLLLKIY